jgi:hypothetical protein
MTDLAKLRFDHADLTRIVGTLSEIIARPSPPPAGDLFKIRQDLNSTLIGHLKAEDWVLYPRLLASGDPQVAATAQRFSDEMGGLADKYVAHTNKWNANSIAADWGTYCAETRGILGALTNRIMRENGELYPLLESLQAA